MARLVFYYVSVALPLLPVVPLYWPAPVCEFGPAMSSARTTSLSDSSVTHRIRLVLLVPSVGPYFAAKFVAEVPRTAANVMVFVAISYWMIGLRFMLTRPFFSLSYILDITVCSVLTTYNKLKSKIQQVSGKHTSSQDLFFFPKS